MEIAGQDFCLEHARNNNQIILGSYCRANCTYCFNKSNPHDLKLIAVPNRTMEQIKACIAELDPNKPDVLLGEFANKKSHKIIHGDISEFENIFQIIELIRKQCPDSRIHILSTNGSCFTPENLAFLNDQIKNVSILIHFCSANKETVARVMSPRNIGVVDLIPLIPSLPNLTISISLVALPHLVGWNDIENTLQFLIRYTPTSIICSLYGYTQFAPPAAQLPAQQARRIFKEYDQFVARIEKTYPGAITFTPIFNDHYIQSQNKKHLPLYTLDGMAIKTCFAAHPAKRVYAFCSEAAYPALSRYFKNTPYAKQIKKVKNHTFGGNIIAGGLLTNDDLARAIRKSDADIALVPDTPYDEDGLDLKGEHFSQLEKRTGKTILMINTTANKFIAQQALTYFRGTV